MGKSSVTYTDNFAVLQSALKNAARGAALMMAEQHKKNILKEISREEGGYKTGYRHVDLGTWDFKDPYSTSKPGAPPVSRTGQLAQSMRADVVVHNGGDATGSTWSADNDRKIIGLEFGHMWRRPDPRHKGRFDRVEVRPRPFLLVRAAEVGGLEAEILVPVFNGAIGASSLKK